MNKNQLILPVSILLASLILGGFYYATQLSKQKSIEKQKKEEAAIRSECFNEIKNMFKELETKDDMNFIYDLCLSKKGLKK